MIDEVLIGNSGQSIPVPNGYTAIDLATGKPVSHMVLNSSGRAGIEVKTGQAGVERHQEYIYRGCIDGSNCVFSAGKKAQTAEMLKGAVPKTIYILRPKGD